MTKIQLSADEMKLVADPEWILTKHRVIKKVYLLFGELSAQMQTYLQQQDHDLPQQVIQLPPKISKGEQYEAMPYVVLDYPRLFSKEEVFAVRTFFWWGNYFSITLHLKGKYQQQYHNKIARAAAKKKLKDFYFSSTGNEFSFDLRSKNYSSFNELKTFTDAGTEQQAFLKISYQISFAQWDQAVQKFMEVFKLFISMK
jgi:hypothetical protein